ncbi:MAG: prepilin peptidase [Lacisediminihabitans sp.]
MVAILVGAFGSVIGSFLNVVVYRLPLGRSIVSPPSACTTCGQRIHGYDNVPVLSWLFLRGKCRNCRAPISARYPAVELGTALLFLLVAIRFVTPLGEGGPALVSGVIALIAFLCFAAVGVALSLIDAGTKTLPNRLVLPSYAAGGILLGASSLIREDMDALLRAAIGMVALGGLYLVLALVHPGGMGLGDVKLAGVIGLFLGWLGWASFAVGSIAAFLLGGLFGIALIIARRAGRGTGIPFGPWMLAGAWIGILAGDPIAAAYLRLFGIV